MKRNSNFELLRILSIIFIIVFHEVWHGAVCSVSGGGYIPNRIVLDAFSQLGELGVNCFLLLSGYFAPRSAFKKRKFLDLIFQANFYVIISIAMCVIAFEGNLIDLIKEWFAPVLREKYWFITVYILVYIISPYLRILINNLSRIEYTRLIIVLLTLYSIIPTIIGVKTGMESPLYYNRLIWAVIMYLLGAYLEKYGCDYIKNKKQSFIMLSIVTTLSILFIIIIDGLEISWIDGNYFWPPNSILQVLCSISLLFCFKYINISSNRIINYCASCTLGIYFFHDGVLRDVLWRNIFKINVCLTSGGLIPYIIFVALIVFCVGILVDSVWKFIDMFIHKIGMKFLKMQ